MSLPDAPQAPSHPNAHFSQSGQSRRLEAVVEQVPGPWPRWLAALATASCGFALVGSVDGTWIIWPSGAHVDHTALGKRMERYMIRTVMLVTSAPELDLNQASAAQRIAYNTLSVVAGLPVMGSRPEGGVVSPEDYAALRQLVGAALRRIYEAGLLPPPASATELETGLRVCKDEAGAQALARYNPIGAAPLSLAGKLSIRAVEVVGGYVLLPESEIDLYGGGTARISRVLEDIHAGILEHRSLAVYRNNFPMRFESLAAIADYCRGERSRGRRGATR